MSNNCLEIISNYGQILICNYYRNYGKLCAIMCIDEISSTIMDTSSLFGSAQLSSAQIYSDQLCSALHSSAQLYLALLNSDLLKSTQLTSAQLG